MNRFYSQMLDFLRKNLWVPFVYAFIMLSLFLLPNNTGKNLSMLHATITSVMHFVGDIFIMIMLDDYQKGERELGSRYQLLATITFSIAKMYSGYFEHAWQFLFTDPAFILSAIKNYYVDVNKRKFFFLKTSNFLLLCLLCLVIYYFNLTKHASYTVGFFSKEDLTIWLKLIQGVGLLTFATSLFIDNSKSVSNILCVIGLSLIVIISGILVFRMFFENSKPAGLEISHLLLPLVVLIYKIKNIFFNNN